MNEAPIQRLMDAVRAEATPLPSHIHVWRTGFAPQYSELALECLRAGLMADDPNLIQSATTVPPPLQCVQDWPVEACDIVSYGPWKASETDGTVGDAEKQFAECCYQADLILGEPAACRFLLNWWDDTPRAEAIAVMLAEVERELSRRDPDAVAVIAGEAVVA